MHNFTVVDLVQTTFAILACALFLLSPGYLLALASNLFEMRRRSGSEKLLFSLAFSIAATPILAVLLTRISSYPVTISFFLLLDLISVFVLIRELSPVGGAFSGVQRSQWLLMAMLLAWFLLVQLSLADWQIGNRLYINYVAFDHSVRVPFVEAAARAGVPPRNPFYGLGAAAPVLRYFYYWYVVCALPMRLFGLGAKACLDASVFWSGIALASLVPLYLKYFFGERENLRAKSVLGIALLAVTGLDILPYALTANYYHAFLPDMEWWDTNQVCSWLGSLLWVPHHVASLTACMAGLLSLSTIDEETPLGRMAWAGAIAGLAFASAAGLSVYVTFSFAVFIILWSLWTLGQRKMRTFGAYAAAGIFTLLLSKPYLSDLLSKQLDAVIGGPAGGAGGGDRFAFFSIREFFPALLLLDHLGIRSAWLIEISKLPVLVFIYLLEFGLFAVIFLLRLLQDRRSPGRLGKQQKMAWTMFTACLLCMSFLKSNTTGANDLGFRGMLVVQFVLLVWAAPIVYEVFFDKSSQATESAEKIAAPMAWRRSPWIKISLLCTLVIGVAGTAFQLLALRCYARLADSGATARSESFLGAPGFAERTYWMRDGFGRLGDITSSKASVQYNPVRDEVIAHLYSPRQAAMGDASCGSAFGGDGKRCEQAFPMFATVFNDPLTVRDWNLDVFCGEYHLDALVATNADPVWYDASSWVWTRRTLLANPGMRAVVCGAGAGSIAER